MQANSDHADLSARTRDYVLRRLSPSEEVAFEDHLVGCAACARDVERMGDSLRRLSSDLPDGAPGWLAPFATFRVAALTAAAIVLILGYSAFLGLHRLPLLESQVRALREEGSRRASEFQIQLQQVKAKRRAASPSSSAP